MPKEIATGLYEANVDDLIAWLQSLPAEFRKSATIEGVVSGHGLSIKRVIAYQTISGHQAVVINPMGTHLADNFGFTDILKVISTMNYDGKVINYEN